MQIPEAQNLSSIYGGVFSKVVYRLRAATGGVI